MKNIIECVKRSDFEMSTIPLFNMMKWESYMDSYNAGLTEGMCLEAILMASTPKHCRTFATLTSAPHIWMVEPKKDALCVLITKDLHSNY